jgi:hypothetical protein
MTRTEIIKKLEAGEYRIEHEENCYCSFFWDIRGGQIDDGADGNECWEGMILYIDDEAIAESIRFDGAEVLATGLDRDDIPDEIWDEMRMSEMVEQGDSPNNDTHEANRREALIDWLSEHDNYRFFRDNQRGFANEYVSVLVTDTEYDDSDEDWESQTVEEWVDDYLYNGDAATKACNDARIIS